MKLNVQGAVIIGFALHQLKNWTEIFRPISKHSNCNCVITFDRHLKTTLSEYREYTNTH